MLTTNANSDHIKQHCDMEVEQPARIDYAAEREKQTTELIDFIVSMCSDEKERDICRRACRSMYTLGRTHQMLDEINAEMDRVLA